MIKRKRRNASANASAKRDRDLYWRALGILHRMATERTGWRRFFSRWYYSHEPLRNDAAHLVREAGWRLIPPEGTKLVGE